MDPAWAGELASVESLASLRACGAESGRGARMRFGFQTSWKLNVEKTGANMRGTMAVRSPRSRGDDCGAERRAARSNRLRGQSEPEPRARPSRTVGGRSPSLCFSRQPLLSTADMAISDWVHHNEPLRPRRTAAANSDEESDGGNTGETEGGWLGDQNL